MKKWGSLSINKMFYVLLILLVTSVFASDLPEEQTIWNSSKMRYFLRDASVQEKWDTLVNANTCYAGLPGGEAKCEVLDRKYSPIVQTLLKDSIEIFSELLQSRINSQKQTEIHFCGTYNAVEGELALSFLMVIHQKRWSDYDGENRKLKKLIQKHQNMNSGNFDPQYKENNCLRKIVLNEKMRDEIVAFIIM